VAHEDLQDLPGAAQIAELVTRSVHLVLARPWAAL